MTKSIKKTVVLYIFFAAFSTAMNICAQIITIWNYAGPYAIEVSILIGTAAGLPVRYFLEKRFIFSFKSINLKHDGQLFILYSFMGIITTIIFWGTEYAFHIIYQTEAMRYFGGVVGLVVGFFIKYQLDKKYVFADENNKVLL